MTMSHSLDIFLNDRRVGVITNFENDQNVFVFDKDYAADAARPTLSLGFLDEAGNLAPQTRRPQTRLLPFFANLLPEGYLRNYVAEQAHLNPVRDFPLLWLLGGDLPGAVIARHSDGQHEPAPDDDVVAVAIERDPKVLKFSLAGIQLKFSAIRETSGGLTIPVHGQNGNWILKMPSATYPRVPENEFAMMTFARSVGIEIPEIELVEPSSVENLPEVRTDLGKALLIKRFDRGDHGKRIHIEDFAQIFNQYPEDKYKNVSYANMLKGIYRVMGVTEAEEFVRRLVFTIAIGNADMHLKNWSVIYRDANTPRLSPAYDYLSTIVYIWNDQLALTIVRERDWAKITFDLLERFARRAEVPRGVVISAARDMVARVHERWPAMISSLTYPEFEQGSILNEHLRSIPIFQPNSNSEPNYPKLVDLPPLGTSLTGNLDRAKPPHPTEIA